MRLSEDKKHCKWYHERLCYRRVVTSDGKVYLNPCVMGEPDVNGCPDFKLKITLTAKTKQS